MLNFLQWRKYFVLIVLPVKSSLFMQMNKIEKIALVGVGF
jgi:hypothetical protein